MPPSDRSTAPNLSGAKGCIALVAIVLLAGVIRLHHIDHFELWHDEASSLFEANGLSFVGDAPGQGFTKADLGAYNTLSHAIKACVFIDSGNGSTYTTLLHYWSILLGNSPFALRSFSILFGLLAIVLVFHVSRQLSEDRWAAMFSAALMALSPLLVTQSHQVRAYMMATFLSLWATALLFRMLRSEKPGTPIVILYGLLAAASILCHYSTCCILLAHPIVAFIMRAPMQRVIRISIGGVLAFVLFIAWMKIGGSAGLEQMHIYNMDYVHQLVNNHGVGTFFSATTPSTMAEGLVLQLLWTTGNGLQFIGAQLRVVALALMIPALLMAILLIRTKGAIERRTMFSLCVLWLSAMAYATVLAMISGHTISYQPHYAAFSVPYACLLLGASLGTIRTMSGIPKVIGMSLIAASIIAPVVSLVAAPAPVSIAPNKYSVYKERLRIALDRYGDAKVVAVHSSRSAAYQCALFAGDEADHLPHFVDPTYPGITGLIVERGTDRWLITLREREPRYHRSLPMDDHTWELNYGWAPALPDSTDPWSPDGGGLHSIR